LCRASRDDLSLRVRKAAAENSSLEVIQYHLYVLDKVRHGLEDAKEQRTFSQDDVEKRLRQWLSE
jgi:predicted transcriptional regulator